MSPRSTPFLAFVAAEWAAIGPALAAQNFVFQIHISAGLRKLAIEIETPTHVALVEAWEHANCLDATVMDARSLASTMLAAGPCTSEAQVSERLAALCARLQAS